MYCMKQRSDYEHFSKQTLYFYIQDVTTTAQCTYTVNISLVTMDVADVIVVPMEKCHVTTHLVVSVVNCMYNKYYLYIPVVQQLLQCYV